MAFAADRRKIFAEEFTNFQAICINSVIIYYWFHLKSNSFIRYTQYFVYHFPSFPKIVFIFMEDSFEVFFLITIWLLTRLQKHLYSRSEISFRLNNL